MYGKYPTLVPAEGIIFTWTGQNREGYADLNDCAHAASEA